MDPETKIDENGNEDPKGNSVDPETSRGGPKGEM